MADNKKTAVAEKKPNFLVRMGGRLAKWGREMRSELKKVVWPTPKQVLNNTIIVVIVVLLVGAIIGLFDLGASYGVQALISAFTGRA